MLITFSMVEYFNLEVFLLSTTCFMNLTRTFVVFDNFLELIFDILISNA